MKSRIQHQKKTVKNRFRVHRSERPLRSGLAPLEMILALPTIVFLFVVIFYVSTASMQKINLISRCRNDAWQDRYQNDRRDNIEHLKVFDMSTRNGVIKKGSEDYTESIRTGFFFDRWRQQTTTQHMLLAQSWDHELMGSLNGHPVFFQTGTITSLIGAYGKDALLNSMEDILNQLTQNILNDILASILDEIIPDFIPDLQTVNQLFTFLQETISDLKESIEDIYQGAKEELEKINPESLKAKAKELWDNIKSELDSLDKEIKNLEEIKSTLEKRLENLSQNVQSGYPNHSLGRSEIIPGTLRRSVDDLQDFRGRNDFVRSVRLETQSPGVFRLVSRETQESEIDSLITKIRDISEILVQLKVLRDQLREVLQSVSKIVSEVEALIEFTRKTIPKALERLLILKEKAIQDLDLLINTNVMRLFNDIKENLSHLKSFISSVSKITELIKKLQNVVKNYAEEVNKLIDDSKSDVKKITDKIESIAERIEKIRNQFDGIKESIKTIRIRINNLFSSSSREMSSHEGLITYQKVIYEYRTDITAPEQIDAVPNATQGNVRFDEATVRVAQTAHVRSKNRARDLYPPNSCYLRSHHI